MNENFGFNHTRRGQDGSLQGSMDGVTWVRLREPLQGATTDAMVSGTGIVKVQVNDAGDFVALPVPSKTIWREEPPQEIIEAAEKVGRWFAERNTPHWVLGPCRSR